MKDPAERASKERHPMFRSLLQPTAGQIASPFGAPGEPGDTALVRSAQADPRAFAVLYDRYFGPVYRYCYVRLGERPAAEDATSEVFLKALAGLDAYRDGRFAAWIFRIAHNVVVDAYRRRRPVAPLDALDEWPDGEPTPEEASIARAERELLRAALAELPDDQRAAVELHLAGWSGEQIASALGRSAPAIRMLRFRALARLRRRLGESEPESREADDEEA
jgi:RNA polymerase sigma-70 factor (ECF subfamily)